jgi:hypothetical protein
MRAFLGIARERVYSPGKVEDDRAILDAVAERLAARHPVRTVSAEEQLDPPGPGTIVFTMCQGPAALRTMREWEAAGIRVINATDSIENCHRHRMQPALEQCSVSCPPGVLVSANGDTTLPDWIAAGAWIKRGDVHATQPGDVVFVREEGRAREVLSDFRARGIASALVQRHVDGVVVKFYAVREGFFACFPETTAALGKADVDAMRALANEGAAALGLEIFGGDCVRTPDGALSLIDLNDWPSYGRCRSAAATAIAGYLDAQVCR